MADIRLAKPAAGTTQTVPSAPDGRFIFDFPADAATLTRNGDDLVLTFEDGAAIQLQGFYTTYSKEEMPSFQVDGVEISGQDFFAALDEDLMPAAGPASGSSAARGGRYNEYGGSDLLDGLDHLGRLDIGFDGGTQLATDTVEPSPYSEVDHGVTVTPSTPGTDPDDPSIPVQGEDFPPTMPHDVLQVDESALDGGSGGGSATAAGSMRVSAPDGVAIITIGGVVVWQNGALTGNPVLTDEGHLDVTGFDGTNLTYTYTLTGSTQEHTKLNAGGENDAIAHEMAVVVTDTDGDSGSAVIRVEITDDVPTIESFEKTVTEGDADPIVGNALEGAVAGADGANFAWTNPDQQGRYGKLTLNEDGTYSYELNNDDPEVKALTDGDTRTEEISYAYTDADGDVATGKVTITINGVNNGVEVGSGTLTVYEAGLDDGSQAGQDAAPTTAEGSLTVNAPDGVKDIRIDGVTVFENGALTGNTVSTDEGTLTVTGFDEATGELKFTYELTGNTLEHNTDATDKQLSHDLAVTVTDVDGSTDTGVVTVVITDDGPVVTPVETEYKGNKYVNTVSVSFGADNDTGTDSSLAVNAHDVDGTVIEWIKVDDSTSSGTDLSKLSQGESWTNGNIIVSRENGNFVFKIKENGSNAHITVTATDADGDTDTEELNLTAPDAGPNAIIVDEALLTDGNVVNSDNSGHNPSGTGSFTVNLNGEDGTVTLNYGTGENSSITLSLINGETFDKDWLSTNKTLTVNGVVVEVTGATQQDGSWKIEYSYSLTGQQTHTGQGVGENDALSDEIDITVTDATGDTSTGLLTVTVHDDGPVLSDVVAEASQIVDTQSTISLDFSGLSVGADSEGATLTVEVNGTTFTGTQDGAGKWNFTSTDAKVGEAFAMGTGGQFIYTRPKEDMVGEANNSYTFNVTVTDADGDAVSDSVTVTTAVKPGFEGQPSEGSVVDNLVTDDSGLDGGNVSDPDGSGEADSAQDTGLFSVTLNGREYTITLTGKEGSVTLKLDAAGNLKDPASLNGVEIEGSYGTLSNISVSGGTISYTYTQTDNYLHDAEDNDRDAAAPGADSFGVTVSDGLNDDVSGTISVTIEDDGPVLSDVVAEASQIVDTQSTISLDFSGLSVGADSEGATLTVEVNGTTFTGTQDGAGKWNFTSTDAKVGEAFAMGTGGQFIYTRPKEDMVGEANNSYTFNVTVTDADGDAVSDSVTVTTAVKPGFEGQPSEGSVVDNLVTDDSGLDGGNVSDPDGSGEADSAQDTGLFSVTLNGREYTITLTGKEGSVTLKLDAAGNLKDPASLNGVEIEGSYGTLSNISVSGGTISYTYTQTDNYLHDAEDNDRDAAAPGADSFGVTVSDGLNDDVSGTISVTIEDDGPVISTDTTSGSSLTVDESYADNVAGPGLELKGSANTDTVSLDVSDLFSVDAGADGEAGREFALSISNNGQTGQKVLVGGSQYDLILRENNDGSISGVAGDENGTVIFNITISNGGNVTLDMTGYGSLVHPYGGSTAQEHDEALSITGVEVTLTVTDTDGDSDSASADLVLTFEDDGPGLTVTTDEVPDAPDTPVRNLGSGEAFSFVPDTPEKPDASDYKGGEEDPKYLAALHEYNTEITAAKQEAEGMAGQLVESDILSQNGWEGVSIYAGKVTYNTDGTVQELDTPENYKLQYSNYASNSFTVDNKPAADWGIMVASPDDDNESWADDNYETNVIDGNASEAIVIDLGGQLAYGIELSFGAFYSNYHGTEGAEKLLITFYKGSELVESRFVDSVDIGSSNTGKVTYSTDLIAGGFDKVVVSAVLGEHGRESSFTLQGVDFVTAPLAIAVASGELDVASGADGYAEDFAVANVQFAMEQMFTLQADGTYSLSILDGNNASKSAIVTVIIDDLGNSRLTATVDGNELFSATLEKDGDGWSWKMEQYQEFLVQGKDGQLGDLELGFITMDGDDDTATETVNIPLKNLPDLAVSQTTLVTDESYIDVLGSGTKPAEGGDSRANSAKASGTMSVNTYGKEGKLILTIDGEEHQFSLDTGGKLFENQGLTVPTTYGQLTLQNDEAPGTIIYTYTQTKHYNHLSEDGPDQLAENAESFTVKVVDGGGNESGSATITVSIEDDAPVVTVNGDVPASLELTESTETALQTFNASTLFDIKFGADTEGSSTKYELTYREDANSGLKAIVDGKEYDVTLQLEGGILKGTAGGTNIFTVSVAEDTGEVTLAMTGHGTLRHDKTAADDELHLKGVGVKVTVTDGDDDSTTSDSADLTLTITDDVPTISESQKAAIIPSSEEDEDIADFDFNNATKANNAEWVPGWVEGQLPESGNGQVYDHNHEYWGNIEDGYKELALNQGNHTITFSAAVVQYQGSDGNPIEHGDQDDDAPSIKITDITDNITSNEAPLLTFVSTAWNQGESGMAVYSGQRGPWGDQSDGEIGAINGKFNEGNTEWEAVKMDLGEDEAYSITIRLNSFYNTPGDQEKAYIILMNDDKVVDKLLIEGKDAEDGIVDSTKLSSAEAFNTVYIVPWGTKSDFLLNGVEVGYSPVTVLKSEGRVEAGSADGIKGYSFGYDQNDVVTVNEKNLTVSVEDDGKTIHFLSSSSDDDTYTKVIVGEATITEVGKWTLNWFDQETNPQQDTDFTLPIIATDGDDDTAEIKVVPSEDEVGDSQAADALPEEEEKQPAAEKREGKDGPQGMMDGALLQSSMAAEAAAPRMAAATLLGMALVADAADDVLAAATGTDGMPHADVKADGLSGDIGDAPSTLHMDGAAQSGADAFDATLDSSLFAPGVMDPLADGTESLEGLLPDKEHAPFDAEGLLFTAAAPDLSDDASGLVGKGVASGDVLPPAGEEGILGTEETDVLHGTDADDILRGGDGDELIFGGSGDDYIDGGEGRDTIYAGDGNDIIVYDKADYLVSGGSGIDFMVSDDSGLTLDTLLSGGKDGHEGPIVDSIEVLLKGNDALSLTSIQELADKYGITLGTNPDGQETLTLDMGKWTEQADGSYDFHGGAEEGGLTLETNLQHDSDASSDNGEMAQQVFILEHTNS
ncbi:DUF5801 repeats-in-toxin domain-containing protein [Desulfovibrio piger]|uniref:DUF5801 repeats-in-toxin domain-containing protein n=1 Tax=Desulfovibrio piger TaxID=901 RepID=UPI0039F50E50